MEFSLLPRNALASERALELADTMSPDIDAAIVALRTIKVDAPDDWVPFLVWEYGLAKLVPYLVAERDALLAGTAWQKMRGTPASLELALSLRGLTATIDEASPTCAHWYDYQVDSGRALDPSEHFWTAGLARASAPVGTVLARVFHDYDVRDFELDATPLGGGLLDAQSGRWDVERQCWFSFGRTHTAAASIAPTIAAGSHVRLWYSAAYRDDCLILDYSRLDDAAEPPFAPAMHSRLSTSSMQYTGTIASGLPWQPQPWTINGPQLHSHHYADHA